MRVGQARRRDAVENSIILALVQVGAEVWQISGIGAPDLLVRFRGRLFAFEVKSAHGKRTRAQEASRWPIVRNADDALIAIGAKNPEVV